MKLVYSYSHKDTSHRESMQTALAQLKNEGLLEDWSDASILPSQSISTRVRKAMDEAEIIVFLLSQDFIASEECRKEWDHAKERSASNPRLTRIPIIVRQCAWKDLLGEEDLKALPTDGKPVTNSADKDVAWQQVYEGIKAVIEELGNDFTPKGSFLDKIDKTDFISERHISLSDIFVFPLLRSNKVKQGGLEQVGETVTSIDALLEKKLVLIHGEDKSGKTALGRHIVLSLIEQARPVLYVDLDERPNRPTLDSVERAYIDQFNGRFGNWIQQSGKVLVIDNLSGRHGLTEFIMAMKESFDKIFVTLPSPVFYSFFNDEARLADFEQLEIAPLTQAHQERLIRRRLALTKRQTDLADGEIDRGRAESQRGHNRQQSGAPVPVLRSLYSPDIRGLYAIQSDDYILWPLLSSVDSGEARSSWHRESGLRHKCLLQFCRSLCI